MIAVNGPNRALVADDIPRMVACGVDSVLILHHFLDQVPAYNQEGINVHCRVDNRGALGNADDEASQVLALQAKYPTVQTWCNRNEPNIESPGVKPADFVTYQYRVASVYSALGGDPARLWTAPISPGVALDEWLNAMVGSIGILGGLYIHAYGDPTEVASVVAKYTARWPSKPRLVTEYNFGAGRTYNLDQYCREIPNVLAANELAGCAATFFFIWEWQTPDMALPTSVNIKNTVVETALQQLAQQEVPVPTPQAERDLVYADLWARNGAQFVRGQALTDAWAAIADAYDPASGVTKFLGAPSGPTQDTKDGLYRFQQFENGVLSCKIGEWIVSEGYPPSLTPASKP